MCVCVWERERERKRENNTWPTAKQHTCTNNVQRFFFFSIFFLSLSFYRCEYVYMCRMNSFDEGQERKNECTLTDLLTLFLCCCCYWWRWWKHDSDGSISSRSRSSNGQIERTTQLAWCKINKETASLFTCRFCRLTTEEEEEEKKHNIRPSSKHRHK